MFSQLLQWLLYGNICEWNVLNWIYNVNSIKIEIGGIINNVSIVDIVKKNLQNALLY